MTIERAFACSLRARNSISRREEVERRADRRVEGGWEGASIDHPGLKESQSPVGTKSRNAKARE